MSRSVDSHGLRCNTFCVLVDHPEFTMAPSSIEDVDARSVGHLNPGFLSMCLRNEIAERWRVNASREPIECQ